jgi:hypothetical protein
MMSRAPEAWLALALAVAGGSAWAGDDGPDRLLVSPRTRAAVAAGYGAPLGATAGIDLVHGLGADVQDDGQTVKAVAGVVVQLQAGTGGGKLSLGAGARAHVDADDFNGPAFAALKASLVRTWGTPVGTGRQLTYLGPELEVSVLHVDVGLGVLARLGGDGGRRLLFAWTLGVRF